jgi:hypothetical protein
LTTCFLIVTTAIAKNNAPAQKHSLAAVAAALVAAIVPGILIFLASSYEFQFRIPHNRNRFLRVLPCDVFKIGFVFAANANSKMERTGAATTQHVRVWAWA